MDSLASLLVRVYVDADTGRIIADHIRARLASGAYESYAEPAEFSRAVMRDLRSVNGDQHLGMGYDPGAPVDRLGPEGLVFAGEEGGEDSAAVEAMARGFHHGLGRLELLTGNVGYAELTGFFDGAGAERMMLAALEYLRDADAVVLDLRGHGGGSGDMSNWLLSHFLGGASLLTLRVAERVNGVVRDRYTLADVPGPRRPDVPLFVLTSRRSASAAEDFVFILDNLGRAVVVGDTTAGAGHNNTLLSLGHGFAASISFSRVTDPRTGREWERVGIAPDIAVPAGDALAAAHLAALDTLAERAPRPASAQRLRLLRETAAATHHPVAIGEATLRAFAGRYGDRRITVRDGSLWYARGSMPEVRLIPLSDSRFTLPERPAVRLEFRADADGVRLVLTQPDGRTAEVPRDEAP